MSDHQASAQTAALRLQAAQIRASLPSDEDFEALLKAHRENAIVTRTAAQQRLAEIEAALTDADKG